MAKTFDIENLTEKEVQALAFAMNTTEGTGYIYFDTCPESLITKKQMRGVMSSLEKKGIIEIGCEHPFEAWPTEEYEDCFPGLYS